MKRIFILMCIMIYCMSIQCFAMSFHSIKKIGFASGLPMGGIYLEGYFYNNGNIYHNYKMKNFKEDKNTFDKGVAMFGEQKNPLYFFYDNEKVWSDYKNPIGAFIGDKNQSKSVGVNMYEGWGISIAKINNSENRPMYLVCSSGAVAGFENYIMFGYTKDDKFVKYFNTSEIRLNWFGPNSMSMRGVCLREPKLNNDSIVIPFKNIGKGSYDWDKNDGEMIFTWDDSAQWFSVAVNRY